jgi:hypothetical protein
VTSSSSSSSSSCLAEHRDVERMVHRHLTKLSQHPKYGKGGTVYKISFIEANMSYIGADQVAQWCRTMAYQPMIIESRDPTARGRVGVWTGPYEKEAYAWTLRDIIESDRLYFAADMVGDNIERDKQALISQLRQFRMERMDPLDTAFGKFKYAYTGKTGGGNKDDLALALMIAIYWGQRRREDPQFILWAKEKGFRLT